MIIGTCPYDCGEPMVLPICDEPVQFERHECEGCGGVIWTRHSRLDPWSMKEADFLSEYDVNQDTKVISLRA